MPDAPPDSGDQVGDLGTGSDLGNRTSHRLADITLDEATAHLDAGSEAAVQAALAAALAGRTSIVIAHRLATIRAADEIAVVDGGRVVKRGTHDQLVASRGLYAMLSRTQFAIAA